MISGQISNQPIAASRRSGASTASLQPRCPEWPFPITIDDSTTGAGRRILPCSSAVPRAVVLYRPDLAIENLSSGLFATAGVLRCPQHTPFLSGDLDDSGWREAMSALGHKRTSSTTPDYVRFRGQSGHPTSAFRDRCNFSPPMSAFGGKADVRELPAVCPLIARSGHSGVQS